MQTPLELLTVSTVTLITTIDQNGPDLLFKEFGALSPGALAGLQCEQSRGKEAKAQRPPASRQLRCPPGKFVGWSIVAAMKLQARLRQRSSLKRVVVRVQDLEAIRIPA